MNTKSDSAQVSGEDALPSEAATAAGIEFAMDALNRVPKDSPETLEAHITGVLILFWGALWGTKGTEFARDFIEAQLRGMQADRQHDVFRPPRIQ